MVSTLYTGGWSLLSSTHLDLGVGLMSHTTVDTFRFSRLAWCARKLTFRGYLHYLHYLELVSTSLTTSMNLLSAMLPSSVWLPCQNAEPTVRAAAAQSSSSSSLSLLSTS